MTLFPYIVMIPQWIIDDIVKLAPQVEPWLTDENRANGWTAESLAGGVLFAKAYNDAIEAATTEA